MQTLAQSWSPLSSVYTTPVWPGSNQKLLNSKIVSDAQTLQQQPLQQQQQPQTKYQYLLCEPQPSQSAGSLSSITTTTHKPVRPLATLATPRLSLVPVGDASVVHSHVTNSCESLLLDLFTDPSVSASAFVLLQEQQLEGGCYCSIQQPPELESSLLQLLSPTSVRAGWTASHQDPHQSSLPLTPTMSSSSSGATASSAIGLVALFPIQETACSHVPTPSSPATHPPSIAYDELFLDVLILPSYRSRGYATEAAKRVLMEHFAPSTFTASPVSHYTNPPLTVTPILPLSASSASIDSHSDIQMHPPIITPTTTAAARVAEKLGMVPTRPRLVHTNPDIHYDCHEINQQDFVDLWVQT
ncbi:hypothetical protein BSLG_002925 [Batrachochytrium salamandrivorans]|nr:hypothetical protein BSLG_002925 [Batrachochytrium salamandrivorans]